MLKSSHKSSFKETSYKKSACADFLSPLPAFFAAGSLLLGHGLDPRLIIQSHYSIPMKSVDTAIDILNPQFFSHLI